MKRITLMLCAGAVFISCNSDKKAGETKTVDDTTTVSVDRVAPLEVDSATGARNWQEYMTPSPMHKMMSSWDGTWDGDVTFWMPGSPEQKSKSTSVNKTIFNGLYQESMHSGNMMGMPFEGKSTTAFDNHRKEFVSTWIDNMGSGIMYMKGTWDSTTKTINSKGIMVDPGTKGDCDVRQTYQIVDSVTHVLEMFGPDPKTKQEMKTMSIKYTKKK